MGNQTINFRIQGGNLHTGIALIVDNYADGVKYAGTTDELPEPEEGDDLFTRDIGTFEGHRIYANYYDSGSDDYVYFAVKEAE